jgi:hypothetical protein
MRYCLHTVVLLLWVVTGCEPKTSEVNPQKIVARVYDKVLLESELNAQLSASMNAEDSINTTNRFINSWIERQLLVRQAEQNIATNQAQFEAKIKEYRNDLLIYNYQNQLLAQKLDTNITEQEIEQFYNDHKERFQLQDYIVKVRYVQLDSANQSSKMVRKNIMSQKDDKLTELERFCYLHSANYTLDDNWMYVSELQRKIPIDVSNKEKLLKNRNLIEFYENGMVYFVSIVDGKSKGTTAPFALVQQNIKNNILNNRRLAFIKQLKSDILDKAKKEQEIEILRK